MSVIWKNVYRIEEENRHYDCRVLAVNGGILRNVRDEIVQYDIDKLILISPLMNDAFLNEAGKILSDKSRISYKTYIADDAQIVSDDTSSSIIADDAVIGKGCVIIANDNLHIEKRSIIRDESSIIASNNSSVIFGAIIKIDEGILITVKNNSHIKLSDKVEVGRYGEIGAADFGKINIGLETTFNDFLYMCSEKSLINIGKDGMFSYYIKINVGSHKLINKNDGMDITNRIPIIIGNHVWCGMGETILLDTQIGDGSVIGVSSLINKKIPSSCTCAGNPAKVLRRDIE